MGMGEGIMNKGENKIMFEKATQIFHWKFKKQSVTLLATLKSNLLLFLVMCYPNTDDKWHKLFCL